MKCFFWDASALGKRYFPEIGSDLVDHLWERTTADRMLCLGLGYLECVSILVRHRNAGRLATTEFHQTLIALRDEVLNRGAMVLPTPNDLMTRAEPLIPRHSINATDAVVLRAAMDWRTVLRAVGDDLVLVSSDRRLVRAAKVEGLFAFDPENDLQARLESLVGPEPGSGT